MGDVIPVELWDLKQTAKYLKMSAGWLYRKVRAKQIPHIRVGVEYRFSPLQIQQWLQSKSEGLGSQGAR